MSTVRPGEAVNGCTEERKEIRRIQYSIAYLYIMYIHTCVGGKITRSAELGEALGTEVMEEVLVLFGKLLPWSVVDSSSSVAELSM